MFSSNSFLQIQFGKRAGGGADQMLFFLENFYEAIKKRAFDQTCLKTAPATELAAIRKFPQEISFEEERRRLEKLLYRKVI